MKGAARRPSRDVTQQAISTILAIWGAILSTGLVGMKILEIWRERPRLSTSYSFASPGWGDNEIIIENPSKTPVIISYWELLWLKRRYLRLQTNHGTFPNEGYCNITIGAHSRHTLVFSEQEYFDAHQTTADFGNIYLRLHVVGRRKPILLKVYEPPP